MILIKILVALYLHLDFNRDSVSNISNNNVELETQVTPNRANPIRPKYAVLPHFMSKGIKLEKFLPKGFVRDGSEDYTGIIQQVLLNHRNIIFPGFPLLINDNGISIPSNTNIIFLKGSKLKLQPSYKSGYSILHISNASNITIYNPVIVGDRYKHLSKSGEWGMGIGIYGSDNISIINPQIYNCWGDGIYIGVAENKNCRNISVTNGILKFNRRNGISIIGVKGLKLEDCYIGNSDGTLPMCGIDIEPNAPKNEIKDIVFRNIITKDNPGSGIQVDVGNLMGKEHKKIKISIYDHTDVGSGVGMKVMSRVSRENFTIQGELQVINPKWYKNKDKAITTILYGKKDVHLTLINPLIIDVNNKKLRRSESIKYMQKNDQINKAAWADIKFSY